MWCIPAHAVFAVHTHTFTHTWWHSLVKVNDVLCPQAEGEEGFGRIVWGITLPQAAYAYNTKHDYYPNYFPKCIDICVIRRPTHFQMLVVNTVKISLFFLLLPHWHNHFTPNGWTEIEHIPFTTSRFPHSVGSIVHTAFSQPSLNFPREWHTLFTGYSITVIYES